MAFIHRLVKIQFTSYSVGNQKSSIPICHFVNSKELYETKLILMSYEILGTQLESI